MELENEKNAYFVWERLNDLFEREGFDRKLTFGFPMREAAVFVVGIEYLNKAGVILSNNKRSDKGNCFYDVMPRKPFRNFPNTISETIILKEFATTSKKKPKKTILYLGLKYGLYRKEDPEKGARLNRRELEYMLNLVNGESIKGILTKEKKKILSANRTRSVKDLNQKIKSALKLEFDLILPGNDYFLNIERYRIVKDQSLSTGLIAL